MIDLNENPEAVYALIQNDLVIVDGEEFIVDQTVVVKDGIYLTKNTSRRRNYLRMIEVEKDEHVYSRYCIHVRDSSPDHFTVFERKELVEHLKNKTYTIG